MAPRMSDFTAFIGSPICRYLFFPIGGCLFGIWVKHESRPAGSKLERDDFAVGLDLIRSSLLMFLALTCETATDLSATYGSIDVVAGSVELTKLGAHARTLSEWMSVAGLIIFFMCLALFMAARLVSRCGWDRTHSRLRLLPGIVVPDLLGILSLCLVAHY